MSSQLFNATRTTGFQFNPRELILIGIDTSHQAGQHPLWDERNSLPVNRALVDSIKAHGWFGSVTVRKEGTAAVVVDGRQRVRAARVANAELIEAGREPVMVKAFPERVDDSAAMGILIMANELRQDDAPMTKARKASRYLSTGKTEAQVAQAFGVAESTVNMWLAVLEMHPDVHKLVESGALGMKAASRLANLPRDTQVAAAKGLVESGEATVDGAAKAARAAKQAARQPAPAVAPAPAPMSPAAPPDGGQAAAAQAIGNAVQAPPAGGHVAPTTAELRRLHKAIRAKKVTGLPPEAADMLAWILGEGPASWVSGLPEALAATAPRKRGPKTAGPESGE
jgi:ParB family chromosome partitioning protein